MEPTRPEGVTASFRIAPAACPGVRGGRLGRVRLLPPDVADRIAAGEVVERPSSVVRELLDNALDAGGLRLEIDLEGGGADAIVIADDGSGMPPEDAGLAFERHATSKIYTGDDLDAVATLGFRGEALAAIAAVSRVEMITRPRDRQAGTRVLVERGQRVSVEPASRAPGTTVAVRDLFVGIPARRKFLKVAATELEHCVAVAERTALARWETGVRLRHHGREILAASPALDPGARIADVLGARVASAMVPGEAERGPYLARAWAGRADLHRGTRAGLHLFVNRRPVRDPLLVRAVLDVYRPILPPGRFPIVVVYLELPTDALDVNVHPAKAEVRFERPHDVRGVVVAALTAAMGTRTAIPYLPAGVVTAAPLGLWAGAVSAHGQIGDATGSPGFASASGPDDPAGAISTARGGPPAAVVPGGVRALAQHRLCYILAEDAAGLLVVDQHVAHERLLFEQLLRQADRGPLPRQALLFPEPMELGPGAVGLVTRGQELLIRGGFAVDPFGPTTVLVREVPAVLGRQARTDALRDILERLDEAGEAPTGETVFRHVIATVACHSAVRKGMPLPLEKMNYILGGLAACDSPSHCPHGRVVSLRIELTPLDRAFGRNA